jgi:hypothetical protein
LPARLAEFVERVFWAHIGQEKYERQLGMKKLITLFLAIFCMTFFLLAQTQSSIPVGGVKPAGEGRPTSRSVTCLQVPFDILKFFKTFNPAPPIDERTIKIYRHRKLTGEQNKIHAEEERAAEKAKEDFEKIEQLGFKRDELVRKKSAQVLKRGPFEFAVFEGRIFLIDPQYPNRAVTMNGPGPYVATKEVLSNVDLHIHFADEVDGIEVEKIGPHTYRIFAQCLTGMKFGRSSRTGVWDYDLKNNSITTYDFSSAFARDVEKKGHRDVIIYAENYQGKSKGWGFYEVSVLSWDGKQWVDISEKEKDFIQAMKNSYF